MIHQQEKNVNADMKAHVELQETLAIMFPDKNKREQAGKQPKPVARHKQNLTDELALLKAKMNELSPIFRFFFSNMKIKTELQFTQLSVSLTLHGLTPSNPQQRT